MSSSRPIHPHNKTAASATGALLRQLYRCEFSENKFWCGRSRNGSGCSSEGYPSPHDLWNHRVSGKSQTKSWRSITCGQNLDVKELTRSDSRDKFPERDGCSPPTVAASTMIARLRGCAQGQMSHGTVEKKKSCERSRGSNRVGRVPWFPIFAKHAKDEVPLSWLPAGRNSRPATLMHYLVRQRHPPGAVNLTAEQLQHGWAVRRSEQRNAVAQQHGDHTYLDVVYETGIQKRAKQFAPT